MRPLDEIPIALLTSAPSIEEARRIARALVESKLVACVNILDAARSIYRWKGAIEETSESLMIMKSSMAKFDAIEKKLKATHPYQTPELIALDMRAIETDYGKWLLESLA